MFIADHCNLAKYLIKCLHITCTQKKLEDAEGMATNFHGELNKFISWLTDTEKTLNNLQPVSRLVERVTSQIEDHRVRGLVEMLFLSLLTVKFF